jgi:hypothetical protein
MFTEKNLFKYAYMLACCFCGLGVGGAVRHVLKFHGIDGDDEKRGGNAFQHCLAACRTHKVCGWRCAKMFWNGREDGLTLASQMDLANNGVGFSCGKEKNCADCCFKAWQNGGLTCLEDLVGGGQRKKTCPPLKAK